MHQICLNPDLNKTKPYYNTKLLFYKVKVALKMIFKGPQTFKSQNEKHLKISGKVLHLSVPLDESINNMV